MIISFYFFLNCEEALLPTNVYLWGHGGYNRLAQGRHDTSHRSQPVRANIAEADGKSLLEKSGDDFGGEEVRFVELACGAAHIVGVTADHKVYTWGMRE